VGSGFAFGSWSCFPCDGALVVVFGFKFGFFTGCFVVIGSPNSTPPLRLFVVDVASVVGTVFGNSLVVNFEASVGLGVVYIGSENSVEPRRICLVVKGAGVVALVSSTLGFLGFSVGGNEGFCVVITGGFCFLVFLVVDGVGTGVVTLITLVVTFFVVGFGLGVVKVRLTHVGSDGFNLHLLIHSGLREPRLHFTAGAEVGRDVVTRIGFRVVLAGRFVAVVVLGARVVTEVVLGGLVARGVVLGGSVVVGNGMFMLGRQLGSFVPGWQTVGSNSFPVFGPTQAGSVEPE